MERPLTAPEVAVSIGEVRRRTGMTSRAIRFYEDMGLFRTGRDHRGLRRYDEVALERLLFIGQARQAGLTLAQISELLGVRDREGPARMAALAQDFYRARLVELQAQLEAVAAASETLGVSLRPPRPQLVALRA